MQVLRDIPYCVRPNQTLALDLHLPDSPPKAMVLYAHGGGFSRGQRYTRRIKWTGIRLAEAGYAMASVSYRLGTPSGDLPPRVRRQVRRNRQESARAGITLKPRLYGSAFEAARQDIGEAIAFLRKNRGDWAVESDQVGMIGVSAGCIAGLSLAYPPENQPTPDSPNAVFAVSSAMVQPWCLTAGGPPSIMLNSQEDHIIGPENAELIAERAKSVGAPLEVMFCERLGHAGPVDAFTRDKDANGIAYWTHMLNLFERTLSPACEDA